MPHCSCGEAKLEANGFVFQDHRLHGAKACARHRTFGEVVRLIVDGHTSVAAIGETFGPEVDRTLLGRAVLMLAEAGILQPVQNVRDGQIDTAPLTLAPGVGSVGDAEKKLAHSGHLHPGDYAA